MGVKFREGRGVQRETEREGERERWTPASEFTSKRHREVVGHACRFLTCHCLRVKATFESRSKGLSLPLF